MKVYTPPIPLRRLAAILFSGLLATACSTLPRPTENELANIRAAVSAGTYRPTCDSISCAGGWGSSRRTAKNHHDRGEWEQLAGIVASIGYISDLTYYYLGRSAEGFGSPAATQYYEQAIRETRKCDVLLNVCDGMSFPEDAEAGIARVQSDSRTAKPWRSPSGVSPRPTPVPSPLKAGSRRSAEDL